MHEQARRPPSFTGARFATRRRADAGSSSSCSGSGLGTASAGTGDARPRADFEPSLAVPQLLSTGTRSISAHVPARIPGPGCAGVGSVGPTAGSPTRPGPVHAGGAADSDVAAAERELFDAARVVEATRGKLCAHHVDRRPLLAIGGGALGRWRRWRRWSWCAWCAWWRRWGTIPGSVLLVAD